MTKEHRDQKLTQIAFQIGLRDVMLRRIEREKSDLFKQYEDTQQTAVEDAPVTEQSNG